MFRRIVYAALLTILLTTCLSGCGIGIGRGIFKEFAEIEKGFLEEWKDNKDSIRQEFYELVDVLLEEINDWSDSASTYSITRDDSLMGVRKQGSDNYVGSYGADYSQFTGEEYIFGGTSLKRTSGSDLRVSYSLNIQSGGATLYWLDGEEENLIADTSVQDRYEFTIHAGSNFIVLKGDDFTGSLSLVVE